MKYTVFYMLRAEETAILRALLQDKTESFVSFKEAVEFIRTLKTNKNIVGEPVLGV
jgi:hypothetical protein